MSLFQQLQQAKSEEDVKDAYIRAIGLKGVQKNLIDIQTKEIWFEAKEGGKTSTYAMFTQLLHYVQQALNAGEPVPKFLCVIDSVKAALMEPFLPEFSKKHKNCSRAAVSQQPTWYNGKGEWVLQKKIMENDGKKGLRPSQKRSRQRAVER